MILIENQPQTAVWSSVLPVLTLVLGWGLASLTEYWKGKRDSAAKTLERHEARIVRRNEFERENMLELQENANELMISTEAIMAHHFAFPNKPSPTEDSMRNIKATTAVMMLSLRIRDAGVRAKANDLTAVCVTADQNVSNKEEMQAQTNLLVRKSRELHDIIGKTLRELDDKIG